MKAKVSEGAIRLIATNEYEAKDLRRMAGKAFKASYTTPHSKHAGTKSEGVLDLWLDEVKTNPHPRKDSIKDFNEDKYR